MTTYRKPIAILFTIAFVVTAVMALLFFNFDRRAFTAETYQQAFAREDFYNKIPSLLAQSITSSTDPAQQPLGMQGMSTETWESFMRTLLPPEVLKPLGDDVLISTFAYINMESDSIEVDLAPVKTSMRSETGTQAAIALLRTLPACTLEQSALIMFGMFTGDQVQLCNPPENVLPMLMPIIQGQMQATATIIPDRLTLVTAPPQNDPRQRLQTIRFFMRLSPILPLIFLLGLTLVAVRSPNDWLTWWGIALGITGFITFLMGVLGTPILRAVLESVLTKRLPNYLPSFLADFTGDFAAVMVRAQLTPVLWQGLTLAIIDSGMFAAGYFINKKK
ncbi:MAG: hypothetical protein IPG80_05485 [Anaerolineales bacterium]|uniref:hypothetical protein n=1 Tax=Candidatus Villigracilis vicinus TaxID=3140679 RepID=UPI0031367257|nr:hypothetical protein [Anaerolineales bacterium]